MTRSNLWREAYGMIVLWTILNFVLAALFNRDWATAADRSYFEAAILISFCWNIRKNFPALATTQKKEL